MCNRKIYKRFKSIHDYIKTHGILHDTYGHLFKKVNIYLKVFSTALGDRTVIIENHDSIFIKYFDKDESLLFELEIEKSGKINIQDSKVDKIAIFSAIYELECLIYNNKRKEKEDILERLFSSTNEFNFTIYR